MSKLTPRERILKTFAFEKTDRPAIDIMENNVWESLMDYFQKERGLNSLEDVLSYLNCDTRWIIAGTPEQLSMVAIDADALDERQNFGGSGKLLENVETVEEIRSLYKPNVNDIIYPDFKKAREDHPDHALIFTPCWNPIFSGACDAFGMQEAMLKMYTDSELFLEYCEIQCNYSIEVFEKGIELGALEYCDFAWMGDDFADNRGPLVSPEMWRSMIKPYHSRIISSVKKHGLKVLFHSCGNVEQFVPDFIEMGVDALLVIQTSAEDMQVENLAAKYGGKIVFWGAVDAQQLLTRGTPEQVREEVIKNCKVFENCGGYVVSNSHHSMPDISGKNIEAMCEAALNIAY